MTIPRLATLLLGLAQFATSTLHSADSGQSWLIDGYYNIPTGEFESARLTNETVGAWDLYLDGYLGRRSIIANVEAGLVWGDHSVFDRSGLPGLPSAPSITIYGSAIEGDTPALGEVSQHATLVGHVLAGTGYLGNDEYAPVGFGMAPHAELWSGAIATEFGENGSFEVSDGSFLAPYKAFFNGILGEKADVINSSWGFSDRAGTDFMTATLDGLARQNSSVAMVQSAGNSGADTVNGLGSGYNGITVGSVSGAPSAGGLHAPSSFSSHGAADFYNPATAETITGVRATVHLAAPGENYALAYYPADGIDPDPDLFAVNVNGTSFSAPLVAGGIALLKDISYSNDFPELNTETARDSRVIRSILMAGASRTLGWNNGQHLSDGVVRTTQSLDYRTGAGMMNLTQTAAIYRDGTIDVAGLGGGIIASHGWDFGSIAADGANDYFFENAFSETIELTISLNWFNNRAFDNTLNITSDVSYVNLDLEIWSVEEGIFKNLVGVSESDFNNSEFLRFVLPSTGYYGVRVLFSGVVFNLTDAPLTSEDYALAWRTEVIPEPSTYLIFITGFIIFLFIQRKNTGLKLAETNRH